MVANIHVKTRFKKSCCTFCQDLTMEDNSYFKLQLKTNKHKTKNPLIPSQAIRSVLGGYENMNICIVFIFVISLIFCYR